MSGEHLQLNANERGLNINLKFLHSKTQSSLVAKQKAEYFFWNSLQ